MIKSENILGVCPIGLIPMRKEAKETSEMVSQILFGEVFKIIKIIGNWAYINLLHDQYEGWIDKQMYMDYIPDSSLKACVSRKLFSTLINESGNKVIIPFGSTLLFNEDKTILLNNKSYIIDDDLHANESLYELGLKYLNTPYLWGGRSPMGIDCSGFIQNIFKACNISLPRDAYQQYEIGDKVDSLNRAQENDLAYFSNKEGKIIHVGILKSPNVILHSSGRVKESKIDATGIWNDHQTDYTHQLTGIRRISLK